MASTKAHMQDLLFSTLEMLQVSEKHNSFSE
jgi:hypothetical protein